MNTDGGVIFDGIASHTSYTELRARDVVKSILKAVQYCHNRDIVHRDLKPENVLLISKASNSDIKVADFGLANNAVSNCLRTQCGTPAYMSPEILQNRPHGKPVDMWSIGVICFILLGGYPPFVHGSKTALYRLIKTADYTFKPSNL